LGLPITVFRITIRDEETCACRQVGQPVPSGALERRQAAPFDPDSMKRYHAFLRVPSHRL
jgi:hypothetical protein